jgi:histidine phosphotransferase ChpT
MAGQRTDGPTPTSVFVGAADRGPLSPGDQHGVISNTVDIRLSELLAARLCHELSGPVAAINNGVELLAEEDADPGSTAATSFMRDAVTLVSESARRASSRLQFYRFAYGFGHGAGAGQPPHELAIGFFDRSRFVCDYAESIRGLPLEWQKLACNLLSVGAEALPRGGRLILADSPLNVVAVGEAAALSLEARAALTLATPITELTSRTVQAYFTGLLAKALDCRLTGREEPGRVRLTAIAGGS